MRDPFSCIADGVGRVGLILAGFALASIGVGSLKYWANAALSGVTALSSASPMEPASGLHQRLQSHFAKGEK